MEENLIDRIGDEYLNPNFQDGQILLNADINEIVSIVKEGINANFNDIQKIQNGSLQVGNSSQLDGATLTKFSDGELEGADNKIPTAQLVKSYVDNKVQEVKDTTEVGQLVENLNELGIEVGNKVDKEDLVNEETTGTDKAYNCDYINELFENGVGDSLPIGTIVEYDGTNIPDGFEEVVEPENATIYVGPTEPKGSQDVWIQKGKNLLNLLKCKISSASSNYNIDNANKITVSSTGGWGNTQIDDFEVIVGKEYVISCNFTNSLNINTGIIIYNNNGDTLNHQSLVATNGNLEIRFTPNTEKIKIKFAANNTSDNHNNTVVYDNIQIEFNNKTSYEPYVEKRIFVRNDNGVYEEFYKSDIVESGENENGSYVKYADGTAICRHKASLGSCAFKLNESGLYTASPGYYTWSFPIEFIGTDISIHATCQSGAYMCSSVGWLYDNTINIFYHTNYECTTEVNLFMTATGRWK